MQLNLEKKESHVSGGLNEQSFGIDEQDMHIIFDILRNKLYSDPIGSICREIASNGRDANREAKVNLPIEISVSKNNPLFNASTMTIAFKDNGPGISPNRMSNVFLKYAASTKRDDNTQTGGFGIGAKSFFSYTDSAIIVTVCENQKWIYNAIVDDSRKGKIILLHKEECAEANGTEIIIPIKSQDTHLFTDACEKFTCLWGKEKPKYNDFGESTNNIEVLYKNEFVSIYEQNSLNLNPGCYALLDGIPYPLNNCTLNNFNKIAVFNFGIGELSVSATREQLQYDERTTKKIKEIFEAGINKAFDEVSSNIINAPSRMAAIVEVEKLRGDYLTSLRWIYDHWKTKIESIQYKGESIDKFKHPKHIYFKNLNTKDIFNPQSIRPMYFSKTSTISGAKFKQIEKDAIVVYCRKYRAPMQSINQLQTSFDKLVKEHAELLKEQEEELKSFIEWIDIEVKDFSLIKLIRTARAKKGTVDKTTRDISIVFVNNSKNSSITKQVKEGKIIGDDAEYIICEKNNDTEYLQAQLASAVTKKQILLISPNNIKWFTGYATVGAELAKLDKKEIAALKASIRLKSNLQNLLRQIGEFKKAFPLIKKAMDTRKEWNDEAFLYNIAIDTDPAVEKEVDEITKMYERYSMLRFVTSSSFSGNEKLIIEEYIKIINNLNPIKP